MGYLWRFMLAVVENPVPTSDVSGVNVAAAVGFKEWAVICDALGSGRQSLILRKGGIAEGRDGFRFKHERFSLFPTQYHQQFEKVRPGEAVSPDASPDPGTVEIRLLMVLDFACWLEDLETALRLEPWHIWREDVVRERFAYGDERGLQCAFGRIYRAAARWTFPDRPAFGGCRSWVSLPAPPAELVWSPVLSDADHLRRRSEIQDVLGIK